MFLPDPDGKTFHFHRITLGRDVGARQAIAAGLPEGQRVVTEGAFTLKSELILTNEPDED